MTSSNSSPKKFELSKYIIFFLSFFLKHEQIHFIAPRIIDKVKKVIKIAVFCLLVIILSSIIFLIIDLICVNNILIFILNLLT